MDTHVSLHTVSSLQKTSAHKRESNLQIIQSSKFSSAGEVSNRSQ